MEFDHLQAKASVRTSILSNRPSPLLGATVYALVLIALRAFGSGLLRVLLGDAIDYLNVGYSINEITAYLIHSQPRALGLSAVILALMFIAGGVMRFGMTSYTLGMSRNENPGLDRLLDSFRLFFRVLGKVLLSELFINLWTVLFLLPAACIAVGVVMLTGNAENSAVLQWIVSLLTLLYFGLHWVNSYRYCMADYYIIDHNSTVLESIRRSRDTMVGRKLAFFVLDMSFVGWRLLDVVTGGVLGVWTYPYQYGTVALFYQATQAPYPPEGTSASTEQRYSESIPEGNAE